VEREHDLFFAVLAGLLIGLENQRHMLRDVYNGMHVKWKKELVRVVSSTSAAMYEFLNSIEKDTSSA